MYKASLFIDGRAVAHTSAPTFEVINPATEEVLGSVPTAGPKEISAAVEAAERGFVAWKAFTAFQRSDVLRRIGGLMRERVEAIALMLTLEIGKPLPEARAETIAAAEYFEWAAEETRRIDDHVRGGRLPGSRFEISHEPVGIVLALTAWNFPVILAARKLAMALAAGCAVIVRPAEEGPGSVGALIQCCIDAGLPAGAVNLLHGSPEAVVAPLMANPAIRKISFTGSTRVGQILIRQSADTVKRLTMELGGHAPFIVLDDADLDKAAAAAIAGKLRNAGQVCTAPTRFLVHHAVHDAFVERLVRLASDIRIGNGQDDGIQMGPLTTERQRRHVEALVADARQKGATVAFGGGRPAGFNRGFFFQPTILSDIPDAATVWTEEPFGPIAAVTSVQSPEEAIARANALEFGLAAYLFTRSDVAADAIARRIEAGVIGVNSVAVAVPEAPFGGIKQSGFGREGGSEGVMDYLSTKFVHRVPA